MAKGGYKPGAGRPPKGDSPDDISDAAERENLTPLEYMLRVMNDKKQDKGRRDRMAIASAPFCHPKVGDEGKKGDRQKKADVAASGKFGPAAAPTATQH